ncbi:MAG: rRNA pseudouridine synthase [Bacteroidetes bacterium]|nr:rRNA pseudouridine synthase [Bacteroidota bacterium]
MEERLNKFIAANGFSSRRKIDEFIQQGRVTVNGKTIFDLGYKIDTDTDKVAVDGERIKQSEKKDYIMMNKPDGVVTTVSDEKHRPTVIDILNSNTKIFPVGRLDYHTTGLLILTNDGDFANKLMNPSFKVYKTYITKLSKPLEAKHRMALEKGIRLEGRYTLPAKISFLNDKDFTKVAITISEGKNRQVRRMFEHYGYFVNSLHRSEYGSLKLGNLKPGEWRKLTKQETESLLTNQKPIVVKQQPLKDDKIKDRGNKPVPGKKDFENKFSGDKRKSNSKPDFKKKFKKDGTKKFTNNHKEKKFDGTKRADKKKIRRA